MNNKIKRKSVFDEMEQKTLGKAGVICSTIIIFYLLIESTYKYINTKDISNCSHELILLSIICCIFYLFISKQKEMNLPKSFLGKTLITEQTKDAYKRRVTSYIYDSISFTIGLSVITYMVDSIKPSIALLETIGLFIISLLFSYIIGEKKCKRYEKWQKSLDEEE